MSCVNGNPKKTKVWRKRCLVGFLMVAPAICAACVSFVAWQEGEAINEECRVRQLSVDRAPLEQFQARIPDQFPDVERPARESQLSPSPQDATAASALPSAHTGAPCPHVGDASFGKDIVLAQTGGYTLIEQGANGIDKLGPNQQAKTLTRNCLPVVVIFTTRGGQRMARVYASDADIHIADIPITEVATDPQNFAQAPAAGGSANLSFNPSTFGD